MWKTLLFIISLSLLQLSQSFAGETITWFVINRPPGMTLDAERKTITGGAIGRQIIMLQDELKGYTHHNVEMNWARFWNEVAHGKDICNGLLLKTPDRLSSVVFSDPMMFILPVHMVFRKEVYEQLGRPETVSLAEIMNSSGLKGGLISKRSYGEQADRILAQHEKNSGIVRYVVDIRRLMLMLVHKRFDYALEYPPGIDHAILSMKPGERVADVVTVPIREIGPFYYIHVGCTKSEWGERVVKDVNRALNHLKKNSDFMNRMKEAYHGESLRRMDRIYREHFIRTGE